VGEQLLWLSVDNFDRTSVAGSLDPAQPNFRVAWREFHGRGSSPLMKALAMDHVEGFRSHYFAKRESIVRLNLRVAAAGGDLWEVSTGEGRELSLLGVAAQFGAVRCARFPLANGMLVRAAEIEAAFRGGNAEVMRLVWDSFPSANPLTLALEAAKSWNLAGFRWLLYRKIDTQSPCDVFRLFEGACS
jgi:hypothetical protein